GLHSEARLGRAEDDHKKALMQDERLESLKLLATVQLMPANQLVDYQEKLAGLSPCFHLTDDELSSSPSCPHCRYSPANEPVSVSASVKLTQLDSELDGLLGSWTNTLLENLDDPSTKAATELLNADQRAIVESFIKERAFPEPFGTDFVSALQQALSGLTKVTVTIDTLRDALLADGSPATIQELNERFSRLIDSLTAGKDRNKVRVVVE
ncbi:MAG: DUF6079 family protein, partial [Candidatus Marsarchaeota archaeon]|nr:DUF6079 family protein [Candidatus Marsarchaeota archaeon]